MIKAIVLLSGGLDSTVMLAMAISKGRECHAISFDYGQRHKAELIAAKAIADHYNIPHSIIPIQPAVFGSSALVSAQPISKDRTSEQIGSGIIPSTYVPARNTIFLSYALGLSETIGAQEIYYGPNALDCLPYVDCRPEFVLAFQSLANVATKQAIEGYPPRILAPLIHWDKAEIIRQGRTLNAPIDLTLSCYDPLPNAKPCCRCDACILRKKGFEEAEKRLNAERSRLKERLGAEGDPRV